MDWADAINALFELGGAAMQWMNVRALYRHKSIRGVWWPAWALFAAWGWWNVYYYGPHLDQWLSWGAGLVIVTANTLWVGMAIYYTYFYQEPGTCNLCGEPYTGLSLDCGCTTEEE